VTRAPVRGERGYSLVEMLTVISILSVVLTGLTTLFVQGSTAELDMNRRFQAQQEARVALDKLRREIHCARLAATTPTTGSASKVTLTLPGQCPTAVGSVETQVSWCTQPFASRHRLYRKVGSVCDTTGVKWADYLTESAVFQYQPSEPGSLARLRVNIPVDIKPGDATPVYALCDQIVLRNSTRTGLAGTALFSC
jgi:prepilin-type N-terminal cleavage/methylation domain-containing protein